MFKLRFRALSTNGASATRQIRASQDRWLEAVASNRRAVKAWRGEGRGLVTIGAVYFAGAREKAGFVFSVIKMNSWELP